MKVKELITKLQNCDPESIVLCPMNYEPNIEAVVSVQEQMGYAHFQTDFPDLPAWGYSCGESKNRIYFDKPQKLVYIDCEKDGE